MVTLSSDRESAGLPMILQRMESSGMVCLLAGVFSTGSGSFLARN